MPDKYPKRRKRLLSERPGYWLRSRTSNGYGITGFGPYRTREQAEAAIQQIQPIMSKNTTLEIEETK